MQLDQRTRDSDRFSKDGSWTISERSSGSSDTFDNPGLYSIASQATSLSRDDELPKTPMIKAAYPVNVKGDGSKNLGTVVDMADDASVESREPSRSYSHHPSPYGQIGKVDHQVDLAASQLKRPTITTSRSALNVMPANPSASSPLSPGLSPRSLSETGPESKARRRTTMPASPALENIDMSPTSLRSSVHGSDLAYRRLSRKQVPILTESLENLSLTPSAHGEASLRSSSPYSDMTVNLANVNLAAPLVRSGKTSPALGAMTPTSPLSEVTTLGLTKPTLQSREPSSYTTTSSRYASGEEVKKPAAAAATSSRSSISKSPRPSSFLGLAFGKRASATASSDNGEKESTSRNRFSFSKTKPPVVISPPEPLSLGQVQEGSDNDDREKARLQARNRLLGTTPGISLGRIVGPKSPKRYNNASPVLSTTSPTSEAVPAPAALAAESPSPLYEMEALPSPAMMAADIGGGSEVLAEPTPPTETRPGLSVVTGQSDPKPDSPQSSSPVTLKDVVKERPPSRKPSSHYDMGGIFDGLATDGNLEDALHFNDSLELVAARQQQTKDFLKANITTSPPPKIPRSSSTLSTKFRDEMPFGRSKSWKDKAGGATQNPVIIKSGASTPVGSQSAERALPPLPTTTPPFSPSPEPAPVIGNRLPSQQLTQGVSEGQAERGGMPHQARTRSKKSLADLAREPVRWTELDALEAEEARKRQEERKIRTGAARERRRISRQYPHGGDGHASTNGQTIVAGGDGSRGRESFMDKRRRKKREWRAYDESAADIPTGEELLGVQHLSVTTPQGQTIPFKDLLAPVPGKRYIVVFIRHWWCHRCAQYMDSIRNNVSQADLDRANVSLIVIGCGSHLMIPGYTKATRYPFDIYTDAKLELFRALGMTRRTNSTGGPGEQGDYLTLGRLAVASSMIDRISKMPLKNPGPLNQIGGEFIFENSLECTWAHRMTNTVNHINIQNIISLAAAPMDYSHLDRPGSSGGSESASESSMRRQPVGGGGGDAMAGHSAGAGTGTPTTTTTTSHSARPRQVISRDPDGWFITREQALERIQLAKENRRASGMIMANEVDLGDEDEENDVGCGDVDCRAPAVASEDRIEEEPLEQGVPSDQPQSETRVEST